VEGGMLVGVAPTNRHFVVQHIHWWRFKDGLIAEHYATRDDLDMMQQLGLIPASRG
jgi:predicted ester cyclase